MNSTETLVPDAATQRARVARARLLRMHFEAGVGHIGGNLSCLDLLLAIYHDVLSPDDTLILSKGHAAGALYVALWSCGALSDEDLSTFHQENTRLSGHPAPGQIPEIRFATGSLGHGLSLAGGLALGKRVKREPGRVYCLLSDGEWQEGSTWEALLFLTRQRLPVTFIVDTNGLQGFGTTLEVAGQEPLTPKLRAFGSGLPVTQIDGHDHTAIVHALRDTVPIDTGPRGVVAMTTKGRGVSFMENRMEWHYLPLDDALYRQALRDIGAGDEGFPNA